MLNALGLAPMAVQLGYYESRRMGRVALSSWSGLPHGQRLKKKLTVDILNLIKLLHCCPMSS